MIIVNLDVMLARRKPADGERRHDAAERDGHDLPE